jgi:hypothetical protein
MLEIVGYDCLELTRHFTEAAAMSNVSDVT